MDIAKPISSGKWIMVFLFAAWGTVSSVQAQSTDDVLRYSLEYPSYDAVSIVMPGVANHTGFGTYQENPAAMALAEKGYMSLDLSTRYVDESGSYLGNTTNFSDSQTGIGNLGFVYKFPTTRGSLVVGGGYSQSSDFNRALSVNGHNTRSTITDFYSFRGSEDTYQYALNEAAFNAYAIEDVNADSSASIFRFGLPFSDYPGINQDVEITERGQVGNYTAFVATEAMENFFVGASIGLIQGTYSYHVDFLESDRQNDYEGQIIDSDGDGDFETDIDNILSISTIDSDIEAFSAQVGVVYQPSENFNIGASYEFPSRLNIEEEINTTISTMFDNGEIAEEEAPGNVSYDIVRPPRLKGGISYTNSQDLTVSAAAEGVFYTEAEYDESGVSNYEREVNNTIRSIFKDVVNFRGGLEYKMNEQFTPRIGYAYFPSPTEGFDRSQQFISGGFTARFNPNMSFNLGLQYSFWDDENTLYEYEDPARGDLDERALEEVTRLHVMAGFKVAL